MTFEGSGKAFVGDWRNRILHTLSVNGAFYNGELLPGAEALKRAGLEPEIFHARDGLATINGSNLLTAMSAIHLYDMERWLKQAEIAAAMSLEALLAKIIEQLGFQLLPAEELEGIPTVCGSLREAIECLKADHEFLLAGDVFTKSQIEGYIDLKMEEIELYEHTPHPVEYQMYYSV